MKKIEPMKKSSVLENPDISRIDEINKFLDSLKILGIRVVEGIKTFMALFLM